MLAHGCTAVVAGDDQQCASDDDCASRGFENATCTDAVCVAKDDVVVTPWGCLGMVEEPEPDPTKTVSFDVRLAYATSGAAVGADTDVDICDKLDPDCTNSDPKYPKGLHPDPGGIVNVVVPEGFDGFVKITGSNLVDSLVYVGRPIVDPPSVEEIQLFAPAEYSALAMSAGQQPDPTRGTAIVLVVDCTGDGGGGVRFETPNADGDTLQFYLINQFPQPAPTETATDSDGFGGFFNLPTGAAVVRAYREEDDAYVGESSFRVVADTISYVLVAPTPQ